MKFFAAVILLVMMTSCSSSKKSSESPTQLTPFASMKGCFLLYNLKTNTFEKTIGEACQERLPACSTFKVALAVMAFDSGVLKDEKQVLKWDGEKRFLKAWNKDQDARSWMRESVVWFSQSLTPKLGKKKFKEYLSKFKYGNEDVSTGITTAWLNSPSDPKGSLAINAYEQVEFMKKLWSNKLPVTKRSMEITRQITYLETSPNGFKLSGKTGSSFYDVARKVQLGWFISHISNGEKEYIAVTNLSDLKPIETDKFGGHRAKEITKSILKEAALW